MAYLHLTDELIEGLSTTRAQEEFYDSSFRIGGSFGVRVSRTGKKVYFLIYSLNGRRRRKTLGDAPLLGLEAARLSAARLVRRAKSGRVAAGAEAADLVLPETFSELCDLFLERHGGPKLSESTRREYSRMIRSYLVPAWGGRAIRSIGSADLLHLVDTMRTKRQSPVMADRIRGLVSKLYNFAIERELAARNPARRVRLEHAAERPGRVLAVDELARVWRRSELEELKLSVLFKLLILTGQRLSDVLELRWEQVKDDLCLMRREISPTKTREHKVVLGPPLPALLKELAFHSAGQSPFVFPGKRTERLTYIRHASRRLSEHAALNPPVSPRDIRRSVRFHLRRLGTKPETIKRMLDAQPEDLERFGYLDELRDAASLWARTLRNELSPPPAPNSKVVNLFEKWSKD